MIRFLLVALAAVAAIAAMTFTPRTAQASDPPWCLLGSSGDEHCRYNSLEACLRDRVGGGGFLQSQPALPRRDTAPRAATRPPPLLEHDRLALKRRGKQGALPLPVRTRVYPSSARNVVDVGYIRLRLERVAPNLRLANLSPFGTRNVLKTHAAKKTYPRSLKRHLSCAHPASYRGVSVQHLQTRGGERWPGNDLASEMRCEGPAVQAACVPARQPRATGPRDGGHRRPVTGLPARPGPESGG